VPVVFHFLLNHGRAPNAFGPALRGSLPLARASTRVDVCVLQVVHMTHSGYSLKSPPSTAAATSGHRPDQRAGCFAPLPSVAVLSAITPFPTRPTSRSVLSRKRVGLRSPAVASAMMRSAMTSRAGPSGMLRDSHTSLESHRHCRNVFLLKNGVAQVGKNCCHVALHGSTKSSVRPDACGLPSCCRGQVQFLCPLTMLTSPNGPNPYTGVKPRKAYSLQAGTAY
jgi:hypothetical protein